MPLDKPSFITECSEDEDGNLLFEIPDELLDAMGWTEGTVLDINAVGDRLILREVRRTDVEENRSSTEGERESEGAASY